jgi:CBS domain-containing protein
MIHPKPALIVRADTSIGDCVHLMKDRNSGSVLVVSDDGQSELIGIFTERDLLRMVKLVDEGHHLTKPVRTVMTKKVKTIELSRLHEALELMVAHGFRHLPVVVKEKDGTVRIEGVISMRDIVRQLVQLNSRSG